jgi:hypothetical protein
METKIERVDEIPVLLHWLKQMRVEEIIDSIWKPHGNWKGLTYGQLAVLFVVYVVHGLNHRLYQMEQWVEEHFHVISQACGWTLSSKDATDDRVGAMMHVLGADISRHISFQRDVSTDQEWTRGATETGPTGPVVYLKPAPIIGPAW